MRSIRSRIHAVVEQGSVAVEYAIFFPLVVVLVLFLIQLSWVGFQSATFDYATRTMVLNLDPDRATEAPDLDAFVAASSRRRLRSMPLGSPFPMRI